MNKVKFLNKGQATLERLSSSRRSKNVLLLWQSIILGLSFLERLSSSQKVLLPEVSVLLI